jgi:serralysin
MCWQCWASSSLGEDGRVAPSRLVADAPQPAAPRLHLTPTGHAGVDGLMSGFAWDEGDPVSFAFTDSAADYEAFYGSSETTRGFAPVGPAMQAAIRRLLLGDAAGAVGGPGSPGPAVAAFTHLAIVEETRDWLADIRIARSSAPATAWAYYPNGREGGDVWFGTRHAFDAPRLGSYHFLVAAHELGHALGLKHAHESGNGFAPVPAGMDGLEYTVMSYRSKVGGPAGSGYTNGTYDYPQGYMMLDIAALQALYGADHTLRAGDTRYAWNPATGETFIDGIGQGAPGDGAGGAANRIFLTIWDGGGIDTYDLSNYAGGVAVDLAPGGHSVLSAAQLAVLDARDGSTARGNVYNALTHGGSNASLIENALGGTGADTLAGNAAANRLEGGAGGDLLDGRDGDDRLLGGAGADTMRGGGGFDSFVVDDPGDVVVEEAARRNEVDTVLVETAQPVTLAPGVEILRLGTAGRVGIGTAESNLLIGNAGADRLSGMGGDDVLDGRGGADTLSGGAGQDSFVFRRGGGFDVVEDFAPGQDRLVLAGFGLSAADVLARATALAGGVALDLGSGDGVLLAGLTLARLSAADLVL